MKPRPSPLPGARAAAAGLALALLAGCASPGQHARVRRPPPPVAGADDVLHRQEVAARARQYIASGEYKTTNEAMAAAERDVGGADPSGVPWSSEYAAWEKQKADDEKFRSDLDKSLRRQ
ncbi:MAG TPA: hypothetical protein VHD61_00600 [Lacunisphaera sp.]|nr:hypothetical protein [Lacunisphaera sp.]